MTLTAPAKDVAFTETEINFLKSQVERPDKESKITQDLLDLCLLIQKQ